MDNIRFKDTSVEQQRIDRINRLLKRLDRIPDELDELNERLMRGNLTRREFTILADTRRALFIEQENKRHELESAYRIRY